MDEVDGSDKPSYLAVHAFLGCLVLLKLLLSYNSHYFIGRNESFASSRLLLHQSRFLLELLDRLLVGLYSDFRRELLFPFQVLRRFRRWSVVLLQVEVVRSNEALLSDFVKFLAQQLSSFGLSPFGERILRQLFG